MKPITKEELEKKISQRTFPDFVIQAFNECIEEIKMNNSNILYLGFITKKIIQLGSNSSGIPITYKQIKDNHWLDVVESYRNAGWQISFSPSSFDYENCSYYVFS